MLSKKMAFSLTSLITIFALAFVVSPAMAQVKVEIMGPTAVGHGGTVGTPADTTVNITIKTDKSVGPLLLTGETGNVLAIATFNKDGTAEATNPANIAATTGTTNTGMMHYFTITVPSAAITAATIPLRVVLTVPALSPLDPSDTTKASEVMYHVITVRAPLAANTDRPAVVSIQRLRPGSQTAVAAFQEAKVTGPFDVRIVITEKPHDFKIDHIEVANGTASGFVVGAPFPRAGDTLEDPPTEAQLMSTFRPHPNEGMYENTVPNALPGVMGSGTIPLPSGADNMYHQYRVRITPHRRATSVKVTVKEFHDNASPYKNYYQPGVNAGSTPNGREKLELDVEIPKHDLEAGYRIYLPHVQNPDFPADGHYILTRSRNGSFINWSNYDHDDQKPDRENRAKEQTVAQLKYNVRETVAGTPADRARTANEPQIELPNLEAFLANNGTIHLVSYDRTSNVSPDFGDPKYKKGDAYISEVMWGTDASQTPVSLSNWIEIRRVGGKIDVGEQAWALWFFEAHEEVPTNDDYHANGPYEGPIGQPGEIIDVIGTKASDTGLSWGLAGKGQSGRSNVDIARARAEVLAPTTPLISMYRMVAADGTISDGTLSGSWMQTSGPSVNLAPGRENAIIATPGAAPFDTPDTLAAEKKAAEDKAKADAAAKEKEAATGTYPVKGDGRIYISEIMFDGGGTLPQWIEIANGDRAKEFNLSGWTITVDNAAADADVAVSSATFTIPDGTTISPSAQHESPSTVLIVTEGGRTNIDDGPGDMGANQIINLAEDNEVDLISAGILRGKYALLSSMAFKITLSPPKYEAMKAPTGETAAAKKLRQANEKKERALRAEAIDTAGNLGKDGTAAWALPMSEGGARSSIIRGHIQVTRGPAAPEDGMMAENWTLASNTSFAQVTHIRAQSYYGAANDIGTPGFRAGGALPVELSHFRPARDKTTGAAVITWATESELNNAGFFIKRSQQRNGEFKVINATMVPGAGTTSEKQFYTYTDTTAQPNVVYYYQIEDVSLDGNRQTLTRGIRLKGHVGAAGKATVIWGELKTSHE